jgi:hypothetical protein
VGPDLSRQHKKTPRFMGVIADGEGIIYMAPHNVSTTKKLARLSYKSGHICAGCVYYIFGHFMRPFILHGMETYTCTHRS